MDLRAVDPRARLVAAALLVAIALVLLAGSFDDAGAEMDEGTLVAYPQFVLDGKLPGRDFETFYGPGEPYLVAGAFEVAGASVDTERAVGFAFRLVIVLSAFALIAPWGALAGFAAGLGSLLAMLPLGTGALALLDAIALSLAALALLATALRRERADEPAAAWAVAGGLVAGLALVFRYDLAPAVVLSTLPFLIGLGRPLRLRALAGFAVGVLPLLAWLVAVGPDAFSRLLSDLAASRPGRNLPIPSPSTLEGQALVAVGMAVAAALTGGWLARRRAPGAGRAATLVGLGLFVAAIVPSTIQRADDAHVLPLACVAVIVVPALVVEAFELWRERRSAGSVSFGALVGATAAAAVVAIGHAGGPTARDEVLGEAPVAHEVAVGERSFPIADPDAAAALTELLAELEAESAPGDSLFVGPSDLRRTNYSETFLYFLTPELEPASFFTELNPGTANADDTELDEELAEADYLLLTDRFDDWDEPNESIEPGSPDPGRVVAESFETVATMGGYELLRRASGR